MASEQALAEAREPALDTIEKDAAAALDVVANPFPLKNRTATSFSTCSVSTEKGASETRDASTIESRGTDGSRDGIEDGATVSMVGKNPTEDCTVMEYGESSAAREVHPSTDNSRGCTVLEYFYSSVETGAAKMFSCCASSSEAPEAPDATAADLLSASASADGQKKEVPEVLEVPEVKSGDGNSILEDNVEESKDLPQLQTSIKKANSQETTKTQEIDEAMSVEVQPPAQQGCCYMFITCSGGEEEKAKVDPGSPLGAVQRITSDTLRNITSGEVHILDSFSDDITFESEHQKSISNYVTPKAQNLLNEIEDLESNFFEVRNSLSKEKSDEVRKRQDPYIKQMATIKQHLQEQQALLQSAPEETKNDYYRAISRAAILNAEVQTRRAELELKKIRLESMRVEDEMDRMSMMSDEGTFDEGTFDSMDGSLMTKESEDRMDQAFNVFARYTTDKFNKMRKNKARKGKAAAE